MMRAAIQHVAFLAAAPYAVQAFHTSPLICAWAKTGANNPFVPESKSPTPTRYSAKVDDKEPDLFDYFDPLLSPHAYPNGISPENAPLNEEELETTKPVSRDAGGSSAPFGFRLEDAVATQSDFPSAMSLEPVVPQINNEEDEDVFDPLLSPHAYPNGTPDQLIGNEEEAQRRAMAAASSASSSTTIAKATSTTGKGRRRVGILLIDHGSRNHDSNTRLHELAVQYQEHFFAADESRTALTAIVRAAHMEIAQPSIPQALQSLLNEHDDLEEIICHPFFLSPLGRHVSEDIPQIIAQAKQDLAIEIPITTTDPVGAEVQILMQAVHTQVKKSLGQRQTQQ